MFLFKQLSFITLFIFGFVSFQNNLQADLLNKLDDTAFTLWLIDHPETDTISEDAKKSILAYREELAMAADAALTAKGKEECAIKEPYRLDQLLVNPKTGTNLQAALIKLTETTLPDPNLNTGVDFLNQLNTDYGFKNVSTSNQKTFRLTFNSNVNAEVVGKKVEETSNDVKYAEPNYTGQLAALVPHFKIQRSEVTENESTKIIYLIQYNWLAPEAKHFAKYNVEVTLERVNDVLQIKDIKHSGDPIPESTKDNETPEGIETLIYFKFK